MYMVHKHDKWQIEQTAANFQTNSNKLLNNSSFSQPGFCCSVSIHHRVGMPQYVENIALSILRPPMRRMKMRFCFAGGLKMNDCSIVHKIALWEHIRQSYKQGGLKIKGFKIERPSYICLHAQNGFSALADVIGYTETKITYYCSGQLFGNI